MKRSPPRAIGFDLDDTLWACDDVISRAEAALYDWLRQHCPRIAEEFTLEEMREIRQRTARQRTDIAHNLTRLRHETLRWHARRARYPENIAEAAVQVFLDERHRVSLYDDVLPVLRDLSADWPLAALTNGNADIRRVGLADYFRDAVSATDAGAAKPDPAMFRLACRRFGIRPGDLVHVGDDPLRDVHAARAIGVRAVWLNRAGAQWPAELQPPEIEIRNLLELPTLLR